MKSKQRTPFAEWLRGVRGDLTQEQLAEKTGLARVTLANLERGARDPDWETVKKIAKCFPDAPPPPLGGRPTQTLPQPPVVGATTLDGIKQLARAELEKMAPQLTAVEALALAAEIDDLGTRLTGEPVGPKTIRLVLSRALELHRLKHAAEKTKGKK